MARLTKTEQVAKEITYAYRCDGCGKVAEGDELIPCQSGERDHPRSWHSFDSGHSEWGNDSVDSYERHDVCSFPCYVDVVRELLNRWPGFETLQIDDHSGGFMAEMMAALPEPAKT